MIQKHSVFQRTMSKLKFPSEIKVLGAFVLLQKELQFADAVFDHVSNVSVSQAEC